MLKIKLVLEAGFPSLVFSFVMTSSAVSSPDIVAKKLVVVLKVIKYMT